MGQSQIYHDQRSKAQDPGANYFPIPSDDAEYQWTSRGPNVIHSARSDGTITLPETQELSNMQRFLQCHEQRALFSMVPACYRAPVHPKPYAFHGVDMQTPWSHKPMAPSLPSPYGSQMDHRPSFDQDSLSSGSVWSPGTNETYPDYETASDRRVPTPCDAPGYASDHGVHSVFSLNPPGGDASPFRGIAPSEVLRYPEARADAEVDHGEFSSEPQLQAGAMNTPYYSDAPVLANHVRPAASMPEDEGIGSSINDDSVDSTCTETDDMDMEDNKDIDTDYKPSQRTKSSSSRRFSKASSGNRTPITSRRNSGGKAPAYRITKRIPRSSVPSPKKWGRSPRNTSAPNRTASESRSPSSNTGANHEQNRCTRCPQSYASISSLNKHIQSTHTRPFVCTFTRYGCSSTFGSKNEWKRHVTSQHLRPGIWRCDIGNCVPKPSPSARRNVRKSSFDQNASTAESGEGWNEFNRKDLFTQHARRMHGPVPTAPRADKEAFEATLAEIRERCWRQLHPAPPRSVCGFCIHAQNQRPKASPSAQLNRFADSGEEKKPHIFEGTSGWEERMEHVGRHLEKQGTEEEDEDVGLREWMVQEGLVFLERGAWRVVGIAEGKKRGGKSARVETQPGDGEEDAEGEDE